MLTILLKLFKEKMLENDAFISVIVNIFKDGVS